MEYRAERGPAPQFGRWPQQGGRRVITAAYLACFRQVEGLEQVFAPAVRAWQRGDLDHAVELLRPLCVSEEVGSSAMARILLADAYGVRGDLEDALLELRLAAGSGHPEIAPMAAWILGNRLEECGDLGGAVRAYQQAIESSHPVHAAHARCYLAELHFGIGEVEAARLTLDVLESMPAELHGWAVALLGDFCFALGDLDGAQAAYQRVAGTDPGDPGDRAAVMFAALIDLGHGGLIARERFKELERSAVASVERSAFVRATLERWNTASAGARNPASISVDPRWLAYGEAAVRFHRGRGAAASRYGSR